MSSLSSGSLMRSSWSILKADKRIVKSQAWGFVASAVLAVAMGASVLLLGNFGTTTLADGTEEFVFSMTPASVVSYVVIYLLINFVAQIVQAVTLSFALAKFRGHKTTTSEVWANVKANMKGLVLFTLLSASIGLVLRFIEERVPLAGKIATWLVGAAWAIASMFSVAVIVDKKEQNPLSATKISAGIFKDTFGPNVRVNLGLGLLGILGFFGILVSGFVVSSILYAINSWAILAGIMFTFGAFIIFALIMGAMTGIIKAGLYEYAVSGKAPEQFNEDMFKAAITDKKARKIFA